MRINQLIALYARMRFALMAAVPVAMWGIGYWMTGEMALALFAGLTMLPLVCYTLPSAGEVRRTLRTRQTTDHIWYMIESRDDGEIRICR